MSMNETLRDAEFKDERPVKTVEKIKGILKEYGIVTEELWYDSGVPYCFSIRVNVIGTTFGVNGKGLTKEFALASGYGELMERLQLGYVGSKEVQKDGIYSMNDAQDEGLPAKELFEKNANWYKALAEELYRYTEVREEPETLLMQYADEEGMVLATPYYNCVKKCKEYFPAALRKRVYTANGCAAGNTMEEAVVQGISEIVERHHQLRIVSESLSLPDVPEYFLKQYKTAYEIISHVRSMGFKVAIKDCSLGTQFPVVCAVFIDGRTGRYHTHFGAYPIFEIALERALTETLQGYNINHVAKFENFTYSKSEVTSIRSLANELTQGTWEKSADFFVGKPQYAFHEDVGFTGKNNNELFKQCIAFFADQGYDVLVRSCSCLGFPTYQILVPGYSEVFAYRLSKKIDDNRYFAYAIKTLRDPSKAGVEDMMGFLKHIAQTKKMTKNISNVHTFAAQSKLSVKMNIKEDQRLRCASLAYVYHAFGNRAEIVKMVQNMIDLTDNGNVEYLICIKRYFSMLENGVSDEQARNVIRYFHREETVRKFLNHMDHGTNPFEEYVLHCDMQCKETCLLYGKCCQKRADELCALIAQKTSELDFEDFVNEIQNLL